MSTGGGHFATAQQEAYHHVRDGILCGHLPAGTRINPAEVAESLGVSRMPVREALRQLDADGLVSMRPNRRAVVVSLTAVEVEELFEIRTALEVLAAKFAARAMTPETTSDLMLLKDRMDRVRHDPAEWVKRHDQFHQAICELGGRKRSSQMIARVRQTVQPCLLMYMRLFNTVEMPGLEHSALLAALAPGNSRIAEAAMREHVANPGLQLAAFLRQREAGSETPHRIEADAELLGARPLRPAVEARNGDAGGARASRSARAGGRRSTLPSRKAEPDAR